MICDKGAYCSSDRKHCGKSNDDKRGIRHQYTEIEVENMEFLTPRTSVSSTQSSLSSQQTQTNQQSETDLDNADKLPF